MHAILILLAIFVYFFIVKNITRWLSSIPETIWKKRLVTGLCIVTALLAPFWDVPFRNWEYDRLCQTKAGNFVYEEVILGPEYWKEDGTLSFLPTRDLEKAIPKEFEMVSPPIGKYSPVTRIRKTRWQIKRKKDQKVVGERIKFHREQAWLVRQIGGRTAENCPDYKEVPSHSIAELVFKQQSK